METTKFKEEELKRWYQTFMKNNPDGQLRKERFQEMFSQLYESERLADHIFNKLDLNQDGHVSFQELMLNLSITMKGSNNERLEWVFDVYDLDGNGEITLTEMKHILMFIRDNSNATEIPEDAFNAQIEDIFNTVDTDSNGVLSLEEFIEGMNMYPSFWDMLKLQPTHKRGTDGKVRRKITCLRNRRAHGNDAWKCKLTCAHGNAGGTVQ